jgi:hypothetical protein
VGGKISYIGCYTGQMIVPQSPITLPKFCVVMMATTLAEEPFKQLKFRLLKNDEVIGESDIPSDALKNAIPLLSAADREGEEVRQTVIQVLQLFPVQVDAPCKYRARAITESGELRGGTLMVALAETPR